MDLKFFVDVAHVERYGSHLDIQSDGSRFVVVTFDDQLQQAQLVWRELILGSIWRAYFAKQFDHPARDLRRHRRPAALRLLQTYDQERRRRLFQQIAASPRA